MDDFEYLKKGNLSVDRRLNTIEFIRRHLFMTNRSINIPIEDIK